MGNSSPEKSLNSCRFACFCTMIRKFFNAGLVAPVSTKYFHCLQENLIRYICFPLQVSFMLCCSPFYVMAQKTNKNETLLFKLKRSSLQNIACALLSFLNILWIIRNVRENMPEHDTKNPSICISFIKTLISNMGCLATLKILWFNQQDFVRIATHLKNEFQSLQDISGSPFNNKFFVIGISLLIPGYTLCNNFIHPLYVLLLESGNGVHSSVWVGNMVQTGRQLFFVDDVVARDEGQAIRLSLTYHASSSSDILLGFAAWLGTLHR